MYAPGNELGAYLWRSPFTVVGSSEQDFFDTGLADDVLSLGAGDDLGIAYDGNDLLDGGPGDDDLYGDEGDDILMGGQGADRLFGGLGNRDIAAYDGDAASGGTGGIDADLINGTVRDGFGTVDVLSGIEIIIATEQNDVFTGGMLPHTLDGRGGDDMFLRVGAGDVVDGGAGFDTVGLNDFSGKPLLVRTIRTDGADVVTAMTADGNRATLMNVERVAYGNRSAEVEAIERFDPIAYAASHTDLTNYSNNPEAALEHYMRFGASEGRAVTFDAEQYRANYADLRDAYADLDGSTRHYIDSGRAEKRLDADPLEYIASHEDLMEAFAGASAEDMKALGLLHFAGSGHDEGRRDGIDFDPARYLANYADLRAAFGGGDGQADMAAGDLAAIHYIANGYAEGRMWEDPLAYIASHEDLMAAFGQASQEDMSALALAHFAASGFAEGRREGIDFDAETYVNNYDDLTVAFSDLAGNVDEAAATMHYIKHGHDEGRMDDPLLA